MPPNYAKEKWLSQYKSREGRAIARRAWEACEKEYTSLCEEQVREIEKLREMVRLLADHEPRCECRCMNSIGLAESVLPTDWLAPRAKPEQGGS